MADKKEKAFRRTLSTNHVEELHKKYARTSIALSNILTNSNSTNNEEVDIASGIVDDIIDRELSLTTDITTHDMASFIHLLLNGEEKRAGRFVQNIDQLFQQDEANVYKYFASNYRNKAALFNDLAMVVDKLYELEEAVNTTRDSIITADDMSQTISRTISFRLSEKNSNANANITTVKRMEDDLGILQAIKNRIVPNVLTFGNYYAYTIPYNMLFQQQLNKREDSMLFKSVAESTNMKTLTKNDAMFKELSESQASVLKFMGDNIQIANEHYPLPLLEADLDTLENIEDFKKLRDKAWKNADKMMDGYEYTGSINQSDIDKAFKVDKDIEHITGCYIKYIHPKHIIPVKLLDSVIGYYYVEVNDWINGNIQAASSRISSMSMTSCMNTFNTMSQDDTDTVVSRLVDGIVSSFDKKFLKDNEKFKELILNALLYDDAYRKNVRFQFIPKEYITHFKIDEDENGEGRSILLKSLFYAKLYLALLLFKMMSVISKSNDTRVYYIKDSGIDKDVAKHTQEAARYIKRNQINIMDLLNYNSMTQKIGANQEMFVPVGKSGEKAIDFDIISGQNVEMNTDFMEMLKQGMINGTGVPSVIMNYINEADYSRTLVMANSKYVGRVASYQLDLNPDITSFYRKLMEYTNTGISKEEIKNFVFTFNAPKTLNSSNLSDMMSTADSITNTIIKALTGDSVNNDHISRAKDIMYFKILSEYVPGINWTKMEEIYKESLVQAQKDVADQQAKDNSSNGGGGF